MTQRNQDIEVHRANTAKVPVTVTQADGSPFDPSLNADIRWAMAPTAASIEDAALAYKSLNNGITIITGGVEIELDEIDTNYEPGVYFHQLQVFDAPDSSTALTGAFVIKRAARIGRTSSLQGELISHSPVIG